MISSLYGGSHDLASSTVFPLNSLRARSNIWSLIVYMHPLECQLGELLLGLDSLRGGASLLDATWPSCSLVHLSDGRCHPPPPAQTPLRGLYLMSERWVLPFLGKHSSMVVMNFATNQECQVGADFHFEVQTFFHFSSAKEMGYQHPPEVVPLVVM
ncbi:hypothetical protein FNV43_RR00407 [Rhamnella rubrinervis]|uniref:Uncharacterized protein n=1 Tax=Rhamnella rubrinervis TaxID=2594499 RepID=A0A8K0MSD3_9ROSA|nr:hypothetical protein FNV43_RR00407 [Rhamnella rubrinervis]